MSGATAPLPLDDDSSRAHAKQASKQASQLASGFAGDGKRASEQASEQPPAPLERPSAFDAIVRPVEAAQRFHLNGAGLGWCLRAFDEDVVGFERCAREALGRWQQGRCEKPLGLLCKMVRDGDYHRPPPVFAAPDVDSPKAGPRDLIIDNCIRCGGRAAIDPQTLRCADCAAAAGGGEP